MIGKQWATGPLPSEVLATQLDSFLDSILSKPIPIEETDILAMIKSLKTYCVNGVPPDTLFKLAREKVAGSDDEFIFMAIVVQAIWEKSDPLTYKTLIKKYFFVLNNDALSSYLAISTDKEMALLILRYITDANLLKEIYNDQDYYLNQLSEVADKQAVVNTAQKMVEALRFEPEVHIIKNGSQDTGKFVVFLGEKDGQPRFYIGMRFGDPGSFYHSNVVDSINQAKTIQKNFIQESVTSGFFKKEGEKITFLGESADYGHFSEVLLLMHENAIKNALKEKLEEDSVEIGFI